MERVPPAQLHASVSEDSTVGSSLRRVGGPLHQQLHVLCFIGALIFVGVAVKPLQFEGNEAVGDRFHFGGFGFGFDV